MRKILYLLAAFALVSCSGKSDNAEKSAADSLASAHLVELDAHELPLPQIPDSITSPSAKADYMMLHFWDAMDFSDPVKVADTLLLEQTFSNFVYLLPKTSGVEAINAAMYALVKQAAATPDALRRVSQTAEKYLYDVESPFQSDTLFEIYLEQLFRTKSADEDRYRGLLKEVKQNATGSIAPDFSFASTRLSDVTSNALYTLLVFYENDCTECQNTIEMMKSDENLANLVTGGTINVVAIDLNTSNDGLILLPSGWIGAQTSAPEDLYVMRRTPSLYLLDSERRVVLKDTSYPVVASCLH